MDMYSQCESFKSRVDRNSLFLIDVLLILVYLLLTKLFNVQFDRLYVHGLDKGWIMSTNCIQLTLVF